MNKCFFLILFLCSLFILPAQTKNDTRTLFTVAGTPVTVSEFEYVYIKNNVNNQSDYSEKSLRDYLALYENFRLKVKEAEALHLDTITTLKNELEGYRKQLAKSYLTDREISDKLIQEAYDRSKLEINASHILVKCDENANPVDTLAAFKKALALKKRMEKGESFEKVAKENSDDPSAKTNEGNIGWFSVFGTIYPFENACYNSKPLDVVGPVRTEFGYHIVRVNSTRPARGQIRVAHLLIRFPEKATQEQKDSVKNRVNMAYEAIVAGKISFSDAVQQFSDDKASRIKGGELSWFGTGSNIRMVPEFEDAAFALAKDSDITKPVMTQYGWHIIQRLEKRNIQPFNEVKNDYKKKVERDTRSQVAKNVLLDRIKRDNAFTENFRNRQDYFNQVDSTILKGNWKADSSLRFDKTLFVLAGKNYTYPEFSDYVEKMAKKRADKNTAALLNEYYDGFVAAKCLEYEESMLEVKKPDFKNLMQEYRNGVLIFELMDREVWSKAVKDTLGLEEFRKKNETKYMWGERALAVIFNCTDEKIANDARKLVEKKKSSEEVKTKLNIEGNKSKVSTIEKKYDKGEYDVIDKTNWQLGLTPIEKLNDSSFRFVFVKEIVKPEPKSLKEAKGYIVSDYQEYLEKTWLESLHRKYPVIVDDAVLRSLVKK